VKRWLVVAAVGVGVFALGVASGALFSSKAYAFEFRSKCIALFSDKSSDALSRMGFIADGHVDWVYDLAESEATSCLVLKGLQLQKCTTRLKLFYDHYPERRDSLESHHPDVARALGYASSP